MASTLTPEDILYQQASIHDDKGPMIIAVSILLITITTVTVVLRFVARFVKKLAVKWDDWLSIAGLIMVILMYVENIVCASCLLGMITSALTSFASGTLWHRKTLTGY